MIPIASIPKILRRLAEAARPRESASFWRRDDRECCHDEDARRRAVMGMKEAYWRTGF